MSADVSNPYKPGHPWYYRLGGKVVFPSEIKKAVRRAEYQGYRSDIDVIDALAEPKRSERLKRLKTEIEKELWRDLSRYRKYAHQLRVLRRSGFNGFDEPAICDDTNTSMSLVYSHLYNHFAHLIRLDTLKSAPGAQRDLFGG